MMRPLGGLGPWSGSDSVEKEILLSEEGKQALHKGVMYHRLHGETSGGK